MIVLFEYLLKSALSITILYMAFELLFKNRVSFIFNRALLLSIVFFGLLIPLFSFNINSLFQFNSPYLNTFVNNEGLITINLQEIIINSETQKSILGIPLYIIIGRTYLLISLVLGLWFGLKIIRLLLLVRKSETKQIGGFKFIILKNDYPTFSFFNYVFINSTLYNNKEESQKIIEHESVHSLQKHTLDILLSEVLIIFQWFNPIAYLIRKSIKDNHEFLADKGIIKNEYDIPDYKLLLLRNSTKTRTGSITHNFSYSLIKKRFKMMEKKDSKIKVILGMMILPLAFSLAFFACSSPENDINVTEKPILTTEEKSAETVETKATTEQQKNIDDTVVFVVVEEMPVFKGGNEELFKFLGNNIKYPKKAKDAKIQGRVFVNFIVEKDGEVTNINVLRGIGSGCDEEAIRVINSMPNWTPGKQRGEYVRVSYNLPIKFALN